jgi:hypothetical protein
MRVFVSLSREDMEALGDLATASRRPLRDQAAWLLGRAIQQERARAAKRRRPPVGELEVARAS